MAGNNVEWTSEQMIENATNWSLAGDVALLNRLKKFSETLLSKTVSVSANVDNLLNNFENVSLKLDLTKNEFQSLRNTQFIENRVYEDDETLESSENKKEEKELTEEEKENAIKESIVKGLKVMEKYFEKIELAVSDSEEEENEKSYILQPRDPYADRPLPYLVGSQEWYKKWHVGLLPSESESESEKEDEIYSSSDSEECLPKDRILGSETSSELDFTNRNSGPVANSTFNDSQDRRGEVFHSSDESSEQSNSLPAKAPISNEKFAEQLVAKLGHVINSTAENLEHNRNPIKKMNQPSKYGNLFSDEPPPLDDLDDTVLPKSAHEGLFSGGHDLFADGNEDDLFWSQQNKTSQHIKNSEENEPLFSHPGDKSKPKVTKGLFVKSDSSSDEDMFIVAEKRKVKITQPYLQPSKTTVPFVDDEPPEITQKRDSLSSKKKPVGGVSIFGENANIFGENSGKLGFENVKATAASLVTQKTEPKPNENVKKSLKKTSLFDESSDEEVITPKNNNALLKKPENQQITKKLSLFDDTDDIVPSKTQDTFKKPEEKKKLSLFDDDYSEELSKKEGIKSTKENKNSIFFDEDTYQNVDLFRPTTKEIVDKSETLHQTDIENKKPIKKISLFDDDDDFLKEEEDIFTSVSKKKSLFDDFEEKPATKPLKGLFEDIESSDTSSTAFANEKIHCLKPSKGLFDDFDTNYPSENPRVSDNLEKNKDVNKQMLDEEQIRIKSTNTLFDELNTSGSSEDLFGGIESQSIRTLIVGEDSEKQEIASQREMNNKKKGMDKLFEESNKKDVDVKTLEKRETVVGDGNKSLEEQSEKKVTQILYEGFESSEEKKNLFKISNVEVSSKSSAESSKKSEEGMSGDGKTFQQAGTSLFQADKDEQKNELKKEKEDIKEKNVGEEGLRLFNNEKVVDSVRIPDQDEFRNSIKDQTETVLKQSKSDLLENRRKNVSFLDSDSESSCDDNFSFGKKNIDDKGSTVEGKKPIEDDSEDFKEKLSFSPEKPDTLEPKEKQDVGSANVKYTESPPKIDKPPITSNTDISRNYSIPPPLDLFDPNPPPPDPDWDIASDNSGESDTFSLTDGILERTNFSQSQARSSLFDEAPPSLDVNDSSGIVRDLNVTRVETDDSSFYPYASSSRRLSSDIYGEQQSQDSFFVTKNRTEASAQPGASLDKISENIENMSSKIANLTPSGDLYDFEGSSVFESKDSKNMDNITSISEGKKRNETEDLQDGSISEQKISVRESANLFERKKSTDDEKSDSSPTKMSPGKLKHSLNINVGALMPGAARPKIRSTVAESPRSDEPEKSATVSPPMGDVRLASPIISPVTKPDSENYGATVGVIAPGDNTKFESVSQTEVLHSATKDRVRIPIKRKPSTRRARQEAVRKSMTDFSLYQNEENSSSNNEPLSEIDTKSAGSPGDNTNNFLKELNNKLGIPDAFAKKETSRNEDGIENSQDSPEVQGISLVFGKESEKEPEKIKRILQNPISEGLFDDLSQDRENLFKPKPKMEDESISTVTSKRKDEKDDIFKSVSRTLKSEEKENQYESNALNPDIAADSSKITEKEEPRYESNSIFEDSFEDNSSIFKSTSKTDAMTAEISKEPTKKSSIFGSGGSDSSDEDLFSSTSRSFKKDILSINKPSEAEETPSKKDRKPNIFSDKSDSEDDSELFFGGKPKAPAAQIGKKMVGDTSKKVSIFDDSDDSNEEDLFGSKTPKNTSGSGDFEENTGSILGTRKVENRNVKIASVKRLENKVTDFDPLSALK